MFSEKKSDGNAENQVSMTCYAQYHCMIQLATLKFC